jgi:hypothetical protein
VKDPGEYVVSRNIEIPQVLALAGGMPFPAKEIKILRKKRAGILAFAL